MGTNSTAAVIASCDQSEYVASSVGSIAPQVDQVVVVDDASRDDSVAKIRDLGLSNLILIPLAERVGVSEAFNIGVEATTADVVLIQGGDDIALPGRVNAHLQHFADSKVSLSASRPLVISSDGGVLPESAAPEFFPIDPDDDLLAHLYYRGNFICAPSVAIRRDDYRRWGGFAPNIDLIQDHLLWMDALSSGALALSPEPLVAYRKHASNTSRARIGIDSRYHRRLAAELEYVLTTFVERAPVQVIERLCEYAGISRSANDGHHPDALRGLLMLSHREQAVQRRGLHVLFDVSRVRGGLEALRELGISRFDLDAFAQQVDHMNQGEIARVAAGLPSSPMSAEMRS